MFQLAESIQHKLIFGGNQLLARVIGVFVHNWIRFVSEARHLESF